MLSPSQKIKNTKLFSKINKTVIYLGNILVAVLILYICNPYRLEFRNYGFNDPLAQIVVVIGVMVSIFDCYYFRMSGFPQFLGLFMTSVPADIIVMILDETTRPDQRPTHNLAPFELIAVAIASLFLAAVLFLVTKITLKIGRAFNAK